MNEAQYIQRVHKKTKCYSWKIHTTMQRGKLDCLYAWGSRHLWIEYKYLNRQPKTINLPKLLSPLQHEEIKTLIHTQQTCFIVVGTPLGGYLFGASQHDKCQSTLELTPMPDIRLVRFIHQELQMPLQ